MIRKLAFGVLFSMTFVMHAQADVSGNWNFTVSLGQFGTGTPTVTMKQEEGGKLTGNYKGQLRDGPFEGTWEGNNFQFEIPGQMGNLTYKGSMQEDGSVKGSIIAQGNEFGTFTGTPSKPAE